MCEAPCQGRLAREEVEDAKKLYSNLALSNLSVRQITSLSTEWGHCAWGLWEWSGNGLVYCTPDLKPDPAVLEM
jgi:hypothetical protein